MPKTTSDTKMKNVIFDFDGTLADSFHVFVQSVEEVLKRPKFTDAEISDLRGLSTRAVAKRLRVRWWEMPTLVKNGQKAVNRRIGEVKLFDGIPELIRKLSRNGFKLYIVTSNSSGPVTQVLEQYGLNKLFPKQRVVTGSGIFGKSKKLKGLIKRQKIGKGSCIYVGDETSDIESAKKVGLKSIAVAWGFNSPESLEKHEPTAIITHPADLPKVIENI